MIAGLKAHDLLHKGYLAVSVATPFFREELDRFAERYRLTAREHDVLFLLVTGCSTVPAIAGKLGLSQNTVHNHFKNVFRRTRTNTKSGLLALFIKEALGRQAGVEPFIRRPHVLVVDPDPAERERMAQGLAMRGMEAKIEVDSTRVLERIAVERIDLVIADLTLPGANGRGVLDDVMSRFGRHPVVIVTTSAPGMIRGEWMARGAGDLFEKPVSSERLAFAVVEHFVDSAYERNRLLRVDTELPARLNDGVSARLGNVGFGGAFVAMLDGDLREDARFPVGSRVRLEFELDDRQRVDLHGEIRWRRDASRPAAEAGIGVQFVEMREEQRMLVEEFVRRNKLVGFTPLTSKRVPTRRPRLAQ
jgi:FixJ family two-component response regulator/Tfp pilus assembly protein PilZ